MQPRLLLHGRLQWNTKADPVALFLTRQGLPTIDRSIFPSAQGVRKGAYILTSENEKPDILLLAGGSEISITLEASIILAKDGIKSRVISFPSWELFEAQSEEYKKSVLPDDVPIRLAVETGIRMGWDKYVGNDGDVISIDHYGASAPYKVLAEKFGFTSDNIVKKAKELLNK